MLAREDTTAPKVIIEQVFSMATVGNTVINKQLKDNLDGRLTVKRKVLSVTSDDLAIAL